MGLLGHLLKPLDRILGTSNEISLGLHNGLLGIGSLGLLDGDAQNLLTGDQRFGQSTKNFGGVDEKCGRDRISVPLPRQGCTQCTVSVGMQANIYGC